MTKYLDITHNNDNLGTFFHSKEDIIPAGTIISSMPIEDKNEIYQQYAKEYDIHFIFDDYIPTISFYSVPLIDIIAYDNHHGFIDIIQYSHENAPICYIDGNKKCFIVAKNLSKFLLHIDHWKTLLKSYNKVHIYNSLEQAKKELEFIEI